MLKQLLLLSIISSSIISFQIHALDQQKLDKLMIYYIKNDDDQFKELLDDVVASSKNQTALYSDLVALHNKLNDLDTFYHKKQNKRLARARKSLTNAIFYSCIAVASVAVGGWYSFYEKDINIQMLTGGLAAGLATISAWFARSNLTNAIVDYNFFSKLLRKNSKFLSLLETLKQNTAMTMELQIPTAYDVTLSVE